MGIRITNIVSTYSLNCEIDLHHVSSSLSNIEYNPRQFSAAIKKMRNPFSSILIFKNGQLVISGSKTETDAKKSGRKIGRLIQKLGYDVQLNYFKVRNIVAHFKLAQPINLYNFTKAIMQENKTNVSYEPEIFPAVNLKLEGLTFTIFRTGAVNVIGAKNEIEIYAACIVFDQKYLKDNKILLEK